MQGDYIGVDMTGKVARGNAEDGINSNVATILIGGTTAGALNVISGNLGNGITLLFNPAPGSSALVESNIIGLGMTGTNPLGNGKDGVNSDVLTTTIGGLDPNAGLLTTGNAGNLISENGGNGITIGGAVVTALVQGNYVGVNLTGTIALPNAADGVNSLAASTTIGGTVSSARNLISGNGGNGITLGTGAGSAVIQGNWVGVDAAGTNALGNKGDGVRSFAVTTMIGGTIAGELNVISGNFGNGITLLSIVSGATALVEGNIIGLDKTGTIAVDSNHNSLGNAEDGVNSDVPATTIGGLDPNTGLLTTGNAGNLISDNRGNGITIGGDVTMALVQGNYVGLNGAGTSALGNKGDGVRSSALVTTIGGTSADALNLLSGNSGNGITLLINAASTSSTPASLIEGNLIGLDVTGKIALGNAEDGVNSDILTLTIGGTTAGERNLISGNFGDGITLLNTTAGASAVVQDNIVGLDVSGTIALPNAKDGINSNVLSTTIGGPNPAPVCLPQAMPATSSPETAATASPLAAAS